MIGRGILCAAIVMSSASARAQALQPTSKWQINPNGTMCVLHREYGTTQNRFTLELKSVPTTGGMVLYVFDNQAGGQRQFSRASLSFGGSPWVETRLETYRLKKRGIRFNSIPVSRSQIQQASGANSLSIRAGRFLNADLGLTDFAAALRALDDCVASQIERWGLAREAQSSIVSWPEPQGEWITANDYPRTALIMGGTGVTSARVRVDRDGQPSDCQMLEKSGNESLDETLCRLLIRAKFKPAIDKSGRAVDAVAVQRVQWLMF